jgi:alpha-ketoglutarate-dependent taurine dioxygenase
VSPIKSEPIKKHIGEVVHVDRAALAEEGFARRCLELLEERAVLVFPKLHLTDEEQLAFTDRMGARLPHYNKVPGAGGDIYKITLDPEVNDRPEYVQGTFFWHMDGLTSDAPPPKATLLSARRPATKGGQTEFASTVTAYESLPAADKKEIAGLRGLHSISAAIRGAFDYASKEERARLDAVAHVREHPLVWKQKSGRTSLVIGESADRIVDMPLANGRALTSSTATSGRKAISSCGITTASCTASFRMTAHRDASCTAPLLLEPRWCSEPAQRAHKAVRRRACICRSGRASG